MSIINRRLVLNALAQGFVDNSTDFPNIRITSDMIADPVIGRYAMLLRLQKRMLALNSSYRAKFSRKSTLTMGTVVYFPVGPDSKEKRAHKLRINNAADQILLFAMNNFEGTQDIEAIYQCDDLFRRRIIVDTMSIDDLRALMDVVVPIALAKAMISKFKIPLDYQCSKQIEPFVEKYRDMIVGDARPWDSVVELFPEWVAARAPKKAAA